ncbi:MAG: LruC domain-containing protein [Bacteroidales bacterium]
MRNFFLIIVSCLLLTSCFKMPNDPYISPLQVPGDFDWKSIEAKKVTITQVSSVLNEDGDTVASFLPPGDYGLIVGKTSTLRIVQEAATPSVQTKAPGDIKSKEKIYFPAKHKYATVMFEDLFPSKGDMDMNDIVFGLNITYYLDKSSNVIAFEISVEPRALGSLAINIGLAAQLSSPNKLNIVENISHSRDPALASFFSVTTNNDGYSPETGNIYSQVLPLTGDLRTYFDNTKDLFLNVRNVDVVTQTEEFSVLVEIKSANVFPYSSMTFLETTQTGKINLDIFAVVDSRGKEIHFKGQRATDKFDFRYFMATWPKSDFSTVDNWVWAVISDQSIRYNLEYVKIYNAYPNFKVWAEGGGATNSDWYNPSVSDSLYKKSDYNYIN